MDKGFKKFQKHHNKINKANDKIIDKALKRILKLKKVKMSNISTRNVYSEFILVNQDTNNSEDTKRYLVKKMATVQDLYPFVSLNYDSNQQNTTTTKIKSTNGNRIVIKVNWQDYIRHAMASVPKDGEDDQEQLPDLGLDKNFEEIKKTNVSKIEEALKNLLSSAKEYMTKEKTDHRIRLVHNTMNHEVTRNHFNAISQHIMKRYHGMIEMYNYTNDTIIIRVHWNIFLAQLAERERLRQQVPLATLPTYEFNSDKTIKNHLCSDDYPPLVKPDKLKKKRRVRKKVPSNNDTINEPQIYAPNFTESATAPLLQTTDQFYDSLPSPPNESPSYPSLEPAKDKLGVEAI